MKVISLLVLAGLIGYPKANPLESDTYQDLPDVLPTHFGVIGVQVQKAAPDTIKIGKVFTQSPAAKAGLKIGDQILAAIPYRTRTPREFSRAIQSFKPGESLLLSILRHGKPLTVFCPVIDIRGLYFVMGEQGIVANSLQSRHTHWNAKMAPTEKEVRGLIRQQSLESEFEDLVQALSFECQRYAADCRLQDVHYVLQNPLKSTQVTAALAAEFKFSGTLENHLKTCFNHLDIIPTLDPHHSSPKVQELQTKRPDLPPIAKFLLQHFLSAVLHVDQAFANLNSTERDELFSGIPPLLDHLGKSLNLDAGDSTQTSSNIATIRLAKKIDLASLFLAASELAKLTTPESLKKIRRLATKDLPAATDIPIPPTFRGKFLYAYLTPWGWVLVGDKGPNFYGENAALIIDIGGDDTYFNNCGSPAFTPHKGKWEQTSSVGLVIDYKGNDRYIGHSPGTVGGALGGIGLLADLEGDDFYQGTRLTQGASFGGVGILWDQRGKDLYLAQEVAQGAAFFGVGLLLDSRGEDFFSSALFSQAFGGPRGFGMLWDQRGDDTYLADRKVASSYGTRGIYQGFSQGMGCGLRGFSSGGIGLLLDAAGNDSYQAGNFSQGCGYFFAMGLLVDQKGTDTYLGSRYAQGASAHQAVGILLDYMGDDLYQSKMAASQGGAWDAAIGILEDRDGNDRYIGQQLSQGAAAMNGFGLLFDHQGKDRYQAPAGQGLGSSTSYWGGRGALNFGILVDVAGDDAYNLPGRKNAQTTQSPGIGLFSDR